MEGKEKNIIKEGYEIIFKEGIRTFTVDRLSSVLHVSKKTIYSFFPSKEALIEKVVKYKLSKIDKDIKHILKKSICPLVSFYHINQLQFQISSEVDINKISDLKIKYPDIWAHIENHRKKQKHTLQEIFSEASKMNYLRKSLDPDQVAQLYMNIIDRTFQPEFFIQEEISLKDTVALYIDIMSKGIFTENALLRLNKIRENNEL